MKKEKKSKLRLVVPILYPKLEQNYHVLNKIKRLHRLILLVEGRSLLGGVVSMNIFFS